MRAIDCTDHALKRMAEIVRAFPEETLIGAHELNSGIRMVYGSRERNIRVGLAANAGGLEYVYRRTVQDGKITSSIVKDASTETLSDAFRWLHEFSKHGEARA